jgi:hypothetical protein
MVEYDPSVIQAIVQQLYNKAKWTVIFNGIVGLIAGGTIGFSSFSINSAGGTGLILGSIFGFFIGNEIGLSKSLLYKFQAQTLLTQVEIEKNTRELLDIRGITSDISSIVQDIADA